MDVIEYKTRFLSPFSKTIRNISCLDLSIAVTIYSEITVINIDRDEM